MKGRLTNRRSAKGSKAKGKVKTLRATIPRHVYDQLDELVKEGWFSSHDAVIDQALQRFLRWHRPEILEGHIREDVERGLRGEP